MHKICHPAIAPECDYLFRVKVLTTELWMKGAADTSCRCTSGLKKHHRAHTMNSLWVQAVTWQDGKPAPYLLIARALAAMEGTTKRLKKDEIMVDAFRAILKRCPGDSSALHACHPQFACSPFIWCI